jgi:competence ComEA-like helix-hairpin-helix protein
MRPAERRAVATLLGLALVGHGVRVLLARPGEAPGAVRILGRGADPRAHADSVRRANRPLGPGERIDLDAAAAGELARLPRIGPGLARAIVADRAANGPFGGLEGLGRVRGIGPALLRVLEPHARFSGQARVGTAPDGSGGARGRGNGLSVAPQGNPPPPLDLNLAGAEDLAHLPGIGPAKAAAVVAWRVRHGPFTTVEELVDVPGIGPKTLEGLRGRVGVGR